MHSAVLSREADDDDDYVGESIFISVTESTYMGSLTYDEINICGVDTSQFSQKDNIENI